MLSVLSQPKFALGFFVFAMALIPLNDALIKLMSDHLSIFQILAMRAIFCLAILIFIPGTISSMIGLSRNTIIKLSIRGLCLVGAMLFFFLPLATLGLAEVTAIFFTAPLLITLLSVPVLGEKLGIYRITAVLIGLAGVLVIVRPGSEGFQLAYIMPILSAISYSAFQLITRYIRNEAPLLAMVAFQNIIYFWVGVFGVVLTIAFAPPNVSGDVMGFLLRGWQTPLAHEYAFLAFGGLIVLTLSFASTNVYSNVEATYVAPFEYVALPTAIVWGILIWGDWPDLQAWIGIAMIIGGGIFMIYRENRRSQEVASAVPMRAAVTNTENLDDDVIEHRQD